MDVATKAARKVKKTRRLGARYFYNERGEPTEVLLPIALYRKLVEQAEDMEDIREIEEVMKNPRFVPWEEAERQLDALPD